MGFGDTKRSVVYGFYVIVATVCLGGFLMLLFIL